MAAKKTTKKKTAKTAGGKKTPDAKVVSSLSVNLGHVFTLRPRARTSFRQADFEKAKHLLKDESFASVDAAARAVAERALELTHEGPPKPGIRRGR